jgi:hypothetical protein
MPLSRHDMLFKDYNMWVGRNWSIQVAAIEFDLCALATSNLVQPLKLNAIFDAYNVHEPCLSESRLVHPPTDMYRLPQPRDTEG